jgi:hypothetical protein
MSIGHIGSPRLNFSSSIAKLGLAQHPILDLFRHVDDTKPSNVTRSSTPVASTFSPGVTPLEALVIHRIILTST